MISLRHISRSLLRNRSYALTATLTMAVGLAATTAVVAVTSAVLLRPLPYPRPDRLFRLNTTSADSKVPGQTFTLTPIELVRLREQAKTLEQVEAMSINEMSMTDGGTPETLKVAAASSGFLRMFGLQPSTGREFTAEEDAQLSPVAILDGGTWVRRFGSDPQIVGKTVRLDGKPYVIIGVTAEGY